MANVVPIKKIDNKTRIKNCNMSSSSEFTISVIRHGPNIIKVSHVIPKI